MLMILDLDLLIQVHCKLVQVLSAGYSSVLLCLYI